MEVIATVDKKDRPFEVSSRTYFSDGSFKEEKALLQREQLLEVYVNDVLTMKVGCSEGSLVELVVGRLLTEGMVAGIDEIDCISICDFSMRADVYLMDRSVNLGRGSSVQTVPTCCTMNRKLNDFFDKGIPLVAVPTMDWTPELVFEAARDFEQDTPTHRATRGTHSCRILDEDGTMIACCEDIGRHNAFDKAIGSALLQGIDLARCIAYTSGRIPTDMAVKAVRAGIPVLVTKKAVTDRALELARQYDLTLIAKAGSKSFCVVNDPGTCHARKMGGVA